LVTVNGMRPKAWCFMKNPPYCMSLGSVQRFRDNDMHKNKEPKHVA
jgi:hypothetical protein